MNFCVNIVRKKSKLHLNDDGYVNLRLVQNFSRRAKLGERRGMERPTVEATKDEVRSLKKQLEQSRDNSLTVIGYDPAVAACRAQIAHRSRSKTIVALAGVQRGKNVTYIASDTKMYEQDKISLASEDRKDNVSSGNQLYIFESKHGSVRWAVLNCHDYSHADLIKKLHDERIELLVVVAYNAAHQLYLEYAHADIHRLFCFIVIANIGETGGSGVFAPFRSKGREANAKLSVGGQLFGTQGSSAVDVDIPLDFGRLRSLRQKYMEEGYDAEVKGSDLDPISPPQSYLFTGDKRPAGPLVAAGIRTEKIEWNASKPTVAFCQLDSLSMQTYLKTEYRLDRGETPPFEENLRHWLTGLEHRIKHKFKSDHLDFLVFPEVFIPRSFVETLQTFSDDHGTIVIAGVGYPLGENVNDCVVIVPRSLGRQSEAKERYWYRKLSRSQYDALRPNRRSRMPLKRGTKLLRFENASGRKFGVLICYDVSHFELVHQINRERISEPLDLLFVVSHNPFGELYRYCCIADAHRFYQHVVMCNIAEYGGSGIFAPMRSRGTRRVLVEAGKGIEAISLLELDLAGQHAARASSEEKLHEGTFMRKPGLFQRRIVFKEA